MSKSPGHQKWPDHKVRESQLHERMQVRVGNEVIADSNDIIRVDEDGHPARFYFPREDVNMDKLSNSDTETECPFKGHARYFSIEADGQHLQDAVWTYDQPYDEHGDLQQRLAFYNDKVPQIEVSQVS